jgi:hypothetical protein
VIFSNKLFFYEMTCQVPGNSGLLSFQLSYVNNESKKTPEWIKLFTIHGSAAVVLYATRSSNHLWKITIVKIKLKIFWDKVEKQIEINEIKLLRETKEMREMILKNEINLKSDNEKLQIFIYLLFIFKILCFSRVKVFQILIIGSLVNSDKF